MGEDRKVWMFVDTNGKPHERIAYTSKGVAVEAVERFLAEQVHTAERPVTFEGSGRFGDMVVKAGGEIIGTVRSFGLSGDAEVGF